LPGAPPPTAIRVLRGHIGRFNADEVAAGYLPSPGLALLCAPIDLTALKSVRRSRRCNALTPRQRAAVLHSVVDIVFRLIREKQGPRQLDGSFGLPHSTARLMVKDASERYGRIAGWTGGEKQPGRHRQQASTRREREA